MRFIRRNGRVSPIRDKEESEKKPRNVKLQLHLQGVSAKQRAKEGAKFAGKAAAVGAGVGAAAGAIDGVNHVSKVASTLKAAAMSTQFRSTGINPGLTMRAARGAAGRHILRSAGMFGAQVGAVAAGIGALHTAFGPRARFVWKVKESKKNKGA